MKVILTEKVATLGNVGEVVNVSAGHARNFLIPNGQAVIADESNQKVMDHHKKALNKKIAEQKNEALETKKKVDGLKLTLIKKVGASGKLFGSVTTNDLSQELKEKGIDVERRVLILEKPIKAVGNYNVKAKLFSDVEADFEVSVEMDPAQAEELKKKEAEALERKKAAKLAAEKEAEEKGDETEEPKAELTEEQKLNKVADELLRS